MILNRPKLDDKKFDDTHFDSVNKVKSSLSNNQKLNYTKKEIELFKKTRPLKKHPHIKENYYVPTFSKYPGAYMIDFIEQSKESKNINNYPRYYFIAININTRYIFVYPQEHKNTNESLISLRTLYNDCNKNIVSIISDKEAGFNAKDFLDELTNKDISYRYIDEQRHSTLGIIDRVIRTLRDMNVPGVEDVLESDDISFRDFSKDKMEKLVILYNNTWHESIDMSPAEMQNDINLERKYIIKKLYESEDRKNLLDYELDEGDYVRYINIKERNKKHRYKVTPEAYKVVGKDGNAYIIMAKDGSTKTIARWRLFSIGKILGKYRFGKTLGDGGKGIPKKILGYGVNKNNNPSTGYYKVEYEMPQGEEPFIDKGISREALRGNTPQQKSILELQYERNKTEENNFRRIAAMRNSPF